MNTGSGELSIPGIVGHGKKRSERHEHWRAVVAEQEASGKSIREFCRERGLTEHEFYWWQRQLCRDEESISFALVETKAAMPARLQLTLRSGEVLQIPSDVESLRVVFEALRTAR